MEFESSTNLANAQPEDASFGINVLASTIAHEIRNPLQAMRLQLDAVKRSGTESGLVEGLSRNLDRLEQVVSRVQNLNHQYSLKIGLVNYREVFESVLSSVRFWLNANQIEVSENIQWEGEPVAEADRQLLEQVLLNLITNAIDAMTNGGRLDLHVKECESEVCIEVSDTGVGMDEQTKRSVGTPFFTTKSNGHGLGLAFCKTIVALHGGQLEINSVLNRGTKVTVRLPKSYAF